ncbi:hypothetical protein CKA32_001213 [Geitlerinema sp. FC II]|nr:hypothetical protein CKA32_001213 [Geitlerinema sp. FC II]
MYFNVTFIIFTLLYLIAIATSPKHRDRAARPLSCLESV